MSIGDVAYFTAWTDTFGRELWRTDGTEAGTWMIRDLEPASADPRLITPFGERVLLVDWDPGHRSSLVVSDGTSDGTVSLTRLAPNESPSGQGSIQCFEGGCYVLTRSADPPRIRFSDGTAEGTHLVPIEGSGAHLVGILDGDLHFASIDETHSVATLWRSDRGLPARAIRSFANISSGGAVLDGRLYFAASDAARRCEIWRTDGTASGTTRVADLCPLAVLGTALVRIGDDLYFPAQDSDLSDSNSDSILYRLDGETQNASPVLAPTSSGTLRDPLVMDPRLGALFVCARDGSDRRSTWLVRGAGTAPVPLASGMSGCSPSVEAGGKVFWSDWDQLWVSAGGQNDAIRIGWPHASIRSLTRAGTGIVFGAYTSESGRELWRSDGTEQGTILVADLVSTQQSRRRTIGVAGDRVLVSDERSIFATGAEPSTIEPLLDATSPVWYTPIALGDRLAFAATWEDPSRRSELWISNGTLAGTEPFAPPQAPDLRYDSGATAAGPNRILATVSDSGNGSWISDGTDDGTHFVDAQLFDCAVPVASGLLLASFGEFVLEDALWTATGDGSSIALLRDMMGLSSVCEPIVLEGFHYFGDNSSGTPLWRSDGTPEGTGPVDIGPGTARIDLVGVVGGRVVLLGHGGSLVATDGSVEGTVSLASLGNSAFATSLVWEPRNDQILLGDAMLFVLGNADLGLELWRTDGTPEGTHVVRDVGAGTFSSAPSELTRIGERAVFAACDEAGCEPWLTDGTEAGTHRWFDLVPGSGSSDPRGFRVAGGRVYFVAYDVGTGTRQLFVPEPANAFALATSLAVLGRMFLRRATPAP